MRTISTVSTTSTVIGIDIDPGATTSRANARSDAPRKAGAR